MKLIINIPEKTYKATCNGSMLPPDVKHVINAIKDGIPLSEELEKIKEEIKEMRSKQNCSCSDCLDILDKHISELKGEKNE